MFTKFHKDWIKIVDFLLMANFWKCAVFFVPDFRLGGPTVFEDLTDSPENQHVFLSLLQNLKSKISEKSDQKVATS